MNYNLTIEITNLTLEQVELLKDYLFDCITTSSVLEPGTITTDQIELIVTDSQ
jgi:late competence protein required for DNA uptake (superfamily II DNA/RNA helicase)